MQPGPGSGRGVAGQPIEILIVDDSAVVRQKLKAIIESDSQFRVTLASDPYDAVEMLKKSVPGAIVLDVEMPRMDGLTFLRKLMRQHPIPVLLCTSVPERAVSALEIGAIEVIGKPDWRDGSRMVAWEENFLDSLRNAARAGRLPVRDDRAPTGTDSKHAADVIIPRAAHVARGISTERVVVVGVSTGGVQTIPRFLAGFPRDCPGIVIVQHMPQLFIPAFADRLNGLPDVACEVGVAKHQEPIRPGRVLVIPGDSHGLVRRTGSGYRVELVDGPPVCRHKPSVEVLFRSAAQAAGPSAAGVILTGMGDDGAGGLLEMRESGAMTVAQDEATSVVFGMPREAIRRGAAQFIYSVDRIAQAVMVWSSGSDSSSRH